jgi:poly(A) polymerase
LTLVQPQAFSPLLEQITPALPTNISVYVVGGAVRDALMGLPNHDLDFVLPKDALRVGRRVANALKAAFYPLDEERETARVVFFDPAGVRQILDFAVQRGPDLESDLRGRDFTINALAVDTRSPQVLLDPLNGAADIRSKILRACSPTAFADDPLRVIRGVRMAVQFNFHLHSGTKRLMRQAIPGLEHISPERLRDELFRILEGPKPSASIHALDILGVLPYLLPELLDLKRVAQSPPHVSDVWTHTLNVVRKLEEVLGVLAPQHDPELAANLMMGWISMRLGRYRQRINAHLDRRFSPERSLRSLLFLAALYHDIAKPQTRQVEESGRVRFFQHERIGAQYAVERANHLRLSGQEADRLKVIIANHLRPLLLAQSGEPLTRRSIFRFFRDSGEAGVDVCLLSLADVLATYGPGLPQDVWEKHLDTVRVLLEAYWEHPEESVFPPAMLNGNDLMEALDLFPGPQIGRLLRAVREAQASGQVHTREEALSFAKSLSVQGDKDSR